MHTDYETLQAVPRTWWLQHAESEEPINPALRNAQVVACHSRFSLFWVRDDSEHIQYIERDLLYRTATEFWPIILNNGPHNVEMRSWTWADPVTNDGNVGIKIWYAPTVFEHVTIATPKWETFPPIEKGETRMVFFCGHCGVAYFWGEKHCSSCGAAAKYADHKRFIF